MSDLQDLIIELEKVKRDKKIATEREQQLLRVILKHPSFNPDTFASRFTTHMHISATYPSSAEPLPWATLHSLRDTDGNIILRDIVDLIKKATIDTSKEIEEVCDFIRKIWETGLLKIGIDPDILDSFPSDDILAIESWLSQLFEVHLPGKYMKMIDPEITPKYSLVKNNSSAKEPTK